MTTYDVRVVPHDPAWAEAFRREAATLAAVFGDRIVAIHHIGSTSVPNLAAKPTIDILIEVHRIEEVDALNEQTTDNGYEAWGAYGLPDRRFFTKNRGSVRTHNVHTFPAGTGEVERHLAFSDYLIYHPDTATAYARLKQRLAREHPTDIESYMDKEDAFVRRTEREALSWSRKRRAERREAPC